MANTPIIDSVIEELERKGIEVNKEHLFDEDINRTKYTNWSKNKLRKSKRNLLNNLPK